MEAQMIHSAQNTSRSLDGFRTGLIVGGILVAIIVSIFLLHDTGANAGVVSLLPQIAITTKQVAQQSANLGVENVTSVITNLFNF
ncbi:MAG TPA: hypothetical protein VK658_16900 [Chryseolinea sp.]|nr:hypothetical protein [Chryseolinea sp.]